MSDILFKIKMAIAVVFGFLAVIFGSNFTSIFTSLPRLVSVPIAYAEEDEEENEDEDHSEESSIETSSEPEAKKQPDEPKKKKPATKTVITYKEVKSTVIVTEPGYDKDSDGDLLVDALDPDPARPQIDYFTDADEDAVPNAFDAHPGEDDFAYFDFAADEDGDSIIDSYE